MKAKQGHSGTGTSALSQRFLDVIEWLGNKLPDPAFLFLIALVVTWGLSYPLSQISFTELDPRSGSAIEVKNQLSGTAMVDSLRNMVKTFIDFPPLGLVIVALLGVGVAEQAGFVQAGLKSLLRITPRRFLTPMLLLVAILSHAVGDSGYVLIIPLGAVMFAAAGRHPVLGITTAFAGISGGFSASFLPASIDPLLQGFTQNAARMIDPSWSVNPLCNWYFMGLSSIAIVAVGWYVADCVVEPRLRQIPVDDEVHEVASMEQMHRSEWMGLIAGTAVLIACLGLLAVCSAPGTSPFRAPNGRLVDKDSPLMQSLVPLIFLLFLLPGMVYGFVSGTFKSHRDVVQAMSTSMGSINYYVVMAFFASQFTAAFTNSNVGVLLAVKGANALAALQLPPQITIVGLIGLTATVNLLIGSASAKWAILSPIFVPMLMSLGLSPELTQAAYRVGDSSTNIITPLMPYFPLVVVFAQRYVKGLGIGTLVSLMLPYSMAFLATWTVLLLVYWAVGLPLGLEAGYTYPLTP